MSSFLLRSFVGSLVCFTASSFAEETCSNNTKNYRMAVRHIESGGIGYNQGYTTLEGFFSSLFKDSYLPFLDLRGHVFDDGRFAANTGVGIRALAGCRTYGINAYYDYRNAKQQHYNQVSAGLETLGVRWDFRVNGYLPVGKKISSKYDEITNLTAATFDSFSGNNAILHQTETRTWKTEYAMRGLDAETAFHFLKSKNFDLYAAAGPYYYNYRSKQAVGGQVRVGAKIYEYLSLEAINSYDNRFHENLQGSIGINIPFGAKPEIFKNKKMEKCSSPCLIAQRMVQDVKRQEIIVVDKFKKKQVKELFYPAINPLTGDPYFFVFVDNTSHSEGTYKSPYPTLALAEENSSPYDIIYVFPGNGTSEGMDSGISLKANQKFWGSAISYLIPTSEGVISIPAQSSSSPIITNTNINTDGNAIDLATHNEISGFHITSPTNNAIYGNNPESLEVSFCTIEGVSAYPIDASFSGDAIISLTNNQFLSNINGVILTLNGTSTVTCLSNTFEDQTSDTSIPIEILADHNTLAARIENNTFLNNAAGGIRFSLDDVVDANIRVLNNSIVNEEMGIQGDFESSFVVLPSGTVEHCSIVLADNTFSGNAANAIYLDSAGEITTLEITASTNVISNYGTSGLVFATPVQNLTLLASDNRIEDINVFVMDVSSSGEANISLTNNQLSNNINGVFLTFEGPSTFVCSDNIFESQTSVSSVPLEIATSTNTLTAQIENNTFKDNTTGSIRFNLDSSVDIDLSILNNTFTNNNTGSQSSLGSNVVIIANGTSDQCSVLLRENEFSGNLSNSFYMHTSGAITTLEVIASANTISDNGGSALVLATPTNVLTLFATDNAVTGLNDNAIAVISSGTTLSGDITINKNTIANIGNLSNGIAINQDFSTLSFTALNNEINNCEGTGIISYAPTGIHSLTLNISGNAINSCENLSSNASSGLDIEQFLILEASVTNNSFSDNSGFAVVIGSTLSSPTACLTFTGNDSNTDYLLTNPVDGLFNLSPCDVDAVNVGVINASGAISPVQSCPGAVDCPSPSPPPP